MQRARIERARAKEVKVRESRERERRDMRSSMSTREKTEVRVGSDIERGRSKGTEWDKAHANSRTEGMKTATDGAERVGQMLCGGFKRLWAARFKKKTNK